MKMRTAASSTARSPSGRAPTPDEGQAIGTETIEVGDFTPPTVSAVEWVNPAGKKVPPAGSTTLPGPKGGMNEDGFYLLTALDNCCPAPMIYVTYMGRYHITVRSLRERHRGEVHRSAGRATHGEEDG